MLYNVYINNGIAIKVTEYNAHCTPCNQMDSVPSQEVRVMDLNIPPHFHKGLSKLEALKQYINLNHIL